MYLDDSLLLDERVKDLISSLTMEEKAGLMSMDAIAIPHLGIPAYNYANEALHGVAANGRVVVFSQAIGMATTWNPDLILRSTSAIGDEARAKYHAVLRRKGPSDMYKLLVP